MQHYRKLERVYHDARCNAYYAPRLSIGDGEAVIELDVVPKLHHAAGAAHGSVYFKLLDDAAFFAANSRVADVFLLTVSFTIQLMQPVVEGVIVARGRMTHRTGRLFFAEAELNGPEGALLAAGSGVFARSGIALGPEVGYR